jgi:hypothetical protein
MFNRGGKISILAQLPGRIVVVSEARTPRAERRNCAETTLTWVTDT